MAFALGSPSPAVAADFSIGAIVVNQRAVAGLGEPIGPNGCLGHTSAQDGPCTQEDVSNGAVSPALPVSHSRFLRVHTTTGTDSVSADARGGIILEPADLDAVEFHGAGTFLVGRMEAFTTLRDSKAGSFHTSASATMSVDDWFDVTVPSTGNSSFRLRLLSSESHLTTQHEGFFSITDLSTGEVLLVRSEEGFAYEEIDLSPFSGLPLRFAFEASVAMSGEAGFGNGADPLTARTFRTALWSAFAFRHVAVPEPGTLPLVVLGLAVLVPRRRSTHSRVDARTTVRARTGPGRT